MYAASFVFTLTPLATCWHWVSRGAHYKGSCVHTPLASTKVPIRRKWTRLSKLPLWSRIVCHYARMFNGCFLYAQRELVISVHPVHMRRQTAQRYKNAATTLIEDYRSRISAGELKTHVDPDDDNGLGPAASICNCGQPAPQICEIRSARSADQPSHCQPPVCHSFATPPAPSHPLYPDPCLRIVHSPLPLSRAGQPPHPLRPQCPHQWQAMLLLVSPACDLNTITSMLYHAGQRLVLYLSTQNSSRTLLFYV